MYMPIYKPFYTASAPEIVIERLVASDTTCMVSPGSVICNPDQCKYSCLAIEYSSIITLPNVAEPPALLCE